MTTPTTEETMKVKLKFKVVEQTQRQNWYGVGGPTIGSVKLSPVSGSGDASDENKKFYEATPGGSIEFATVNNAALQALPVGAEVYVTLEVAQSA